MHDISRDTPADGGANGPASGELLTRHEVNLRRYAAVAAIQRKEVSL
jgi:hypothetical protein